MARRSPVHHRRDVPRFDHRLREAVARHLEHSAAELLGGGDVVGEDGLQHGEERPEARHRDPDPAGARGNAVQRDDGRGAEHVGGAEPHPQHGVLGLALHARPHHAAALGAVRARPRHEGEGQPRVQPQQRACDRDRQVVRQPRVLRLRQAGRRDAEAEQAGIEPHQLPFHRGQVGHVGHHDVAQLFVVLARGAAAHRGHALHAVVQQALAQRPLPHHPRGSEQHDIHGFLDDRSRTGRGSAGH